MFCRNLLKDKALSLSMRQNLVDECPELPPNWTHAGRPRRGLWSAMLLPQDSIVLAHPHPNWHHCCSAPGAFLTLKGTAKLHFLPPALIVCQLPRKKGKRHFSYMLRKKKKKVRFQKLFSTLLHPRKATLHFTNSSHFNFSPLTFGLFPLYLNSCLFFLDKISEISLSQSQC